MTTTGASKPNGGQQWLPRRQNLLRGRTTRQPGALLALAVLLSLVPFDEAQITFSAANIITTTSLNPFTMTAGDVNHDTYTDVVVRSLVTV